MNGWIKLPWRCEDCGAKGIDWGVPEKCPSCGGENCSPVKKEEEESS